MTTDADLVDVLAMVNDNVHPAPYPLGAELPVLTYQRISTRWVRSHQGISVGFGLYQIVAWDRTASAARAARRELLGILEPMIGTAFVEDVRDGYDPERKVFRADLDVRWWADLDEEVGVSS